MPDMSRMDGIVTLSERKAAEATRRQRAVGELRLALDAYGRAHGGRFLLFGSAARGDMRYDSDVDILLDFPPDRLSSAWRFAERACRDRRLEPDIMPFEWCKDDFLAHARPDFVVLG
jgi:predicted nucleotidyltransferase